MGIPGGGAALYAVELLLQGAESFLQLPWCRPIEASQDLLGSLCRALELLHQIFSLCQLSLKLFHRSLVTCFGGFGYLLLQPLGIAFEVSEHLLSLFAVDRQDYICGGTVVCHNFSL